MAGKLRGSSVINKLFLLIALLIATPAWSATYYVSSSSGNDGYTGLAANLPWKTVNKVNIALMNGKAAPGTIVCFKGGDTWTSTSNTAGVNDAELDISGMNGTAANPIVLGACNGFGTGYPVLNANNTANFGVAAGATTPPPAIPTTQNISYVTITGFEIKGALIQALTFQSYRGTITNVTFSGNYIHNTGPGCSNTTGACAGSSVSYDNQLDFEDTGGGTGVMYNDGVSMINNTVKYTGGWNCLEVHYDGGASVIQSNTIGPGCIHGFIDVKGIGGTGRQAQITNNTVQGGQAEGLCTLYTGCAVAYYTENGINPNSNILWSGNVSYDMSGGIHICLGGAISAATVSHTYKIYNNTFYSTSSSGYGPVADFNCTGSSTGTFNPGSIDIQNNVFDVGSAAGTVPTVNMPSSLSSWYSSCTQDYNDMGGSQGGTGLNGCSGATLNTHEVNAVNPQYVNAAAGNFNYQNTSPLIGVGNPSLTGNSNIGAYAGVNTGATPTPGTSPTPPGPTPTATPTPTLPSPSVSQTLKNFHAYGALGMNGLSGAGDYITGVNVNDLIHPYAYGAKCDGTTDDTAAFVTNNPSVMSTLNARPSACVLLPTGLCVVNQPLTINIEGGCIIGQDMSGLQMNVANLPQISVNVHQFRLSHIRLTRTVTAVSGGDGIVVNNDADNPVIEYIWEQKSYYGLDLHGASYGRIQYDIIGQNIVDGILMNSLVGAEQWNITDVLSVSNGGSGFHAVNTTGTFNNLAPWIHPYTWNNHQYGIFIQGGGAPGTGIYDGQIVGWTSSGDCLAGILLDTAGGDYSVTNGYQEFGGRISGCTPPGGYGIGIILGPTNIGPIIISNNVISSNASYGIYDQSNYNVQYNNNQVKLNGASGVVFTGSSPGYKQLTGGFMQGNTGYGVADSGTIPVYEVGVMCFGNSSSPYAGPLASDIGGRCPN